MVSAIVSRAAGSVAGVASVGGNDTIASNLINVFTNKSIAPSQVVESVVENDALHIGVHLAVFYGYPFTKLAAEVRGVVATAVNEQIGVRISAVDIYIDSLVFPKSSFERKVLWPHISSKPGTAASFFRLSRQIVP